METTNNPIFDVGAVVYCVESIPIWDGVLTKGNLYVVLNTSEEGMVMVETDTNHLRWYNSSRFSYRSPQKKTTRKDTKRYLDF